MNGNDTLSDIIVNFHNEAFLEDLPFNNLKENMNLIESLDKLGLLLEFDGVILEKF
ncbi:MAG: hypothetical protein GF364_19250 [Candidatus Lokiarchaeota archaeon]|nr:hypothetical protein [Candidatus Lokiarchaeota archaeon]